MDADTLLATLLSLGFDFDNCQLAIAEGKTTPESAVEWLLHRNNQNENMTEGEPQTTLSHVTNESRTASTPNNPVDLVVSRYSTSESQKMAEKDFDRRQRDSIQREIKKIKVMDKKVRQQVLEQFKEDRDITKSRKATIMSQHGKTITPYCDVVDDVQCSSNTSSAKCNLKIRLTNGKNVVEVCNCNELLSSVIERVKHRYNETHDVDILQPFPQKKFTLEDIQKSLGQLGLVPGGCLVFKSRINSDRNDNPQHGENNPERSLGENVENIAIPPEVQRGYANENIADQPGDNPRGDGLAEGLNVLGVGPMWPNQLQHSWGAGISLGRREYNPHAIDPVVHAHSPAEAAVSRSRFDAISRQDDQSKSHNISSSNQGLPSLIDICVKDIARRLPGHQHPVKSLGNLSPRMCQKILKHMMKKKTLTPKTLNRFIPCQLQQLVLDNYLYVTNELFHTLRYFRSLTHLSVQSCTVFTDKALEAIAGLKKIIFLNFSNCTQLTNKYLSHLKSLENLETLKLDNTKVSDQGMCDMLSGAGLGKLSRLSLNKTDISDDTLWALKDKNKLKELNVEQTNISDLQPLRNMTNLIQLNVGGTKITNQSLSALSNHSLLTKLNLHQTHVTDEGLRHLKGLQLKELCLPGRLNVTDKGIQYIKELPLTALDLTDYVNITDDALTSISYMHRLSRLLLSKTKISDNGIVCLAGLCELKELDLERTAIGDAGLQVLSCFGKLEELNLSGTNITDDCLLSGKLNMRLLCKLNLSRTNVSDRGVANLQLPSLMLVNLDWTKTSDDCVEKLLTDCPQIKVLRRQNCLPQGN